MLTNQECTPIDMDLHRRSRVLSVLVRVRPCLAVDGLLVFCLAAVLLTGCVERRLTVNTEPPGAIVTLNDQEIGVSPVTVPFNWYGDYWVRISKDGYETLNTHRKLRPPLHDHPPLDFFAQILWPGRIVDAYEWTFDLAPKVYPTRDELIEQGQSLRTQVQ